MRIVMVGHTYVPRDTRVRKEAVALADAGHDVTVVCLRGEAEARSGSFRGVSISRLPIARRRASGKLGYLLEYAAFFALAATRLTRMNASGPIDVVYVHNIPDELVFCGALQRLRGSRMILDLHDPMPELFLDKYGLSPESSAYRLLKRWQSASCRFADHVIVSSEGIRDSIVAGGYPPESVTVIINGPETHPVDGLNIVYHGSMFERYGIETVLRGLALAGERLPEARLLIFGSDVDPVHEQRLRTVARSLGISHRVAFSGPVEPLVVGQHLRWADLGVVPARRSAHIDLVYSTKLFECMSAGLPVIVARTPPLVQRFGESLDFYDPEDPEDFARVLTRVAAGLTRSIHAREPRVSLPDELQWSSIAGALVEAVTEPRPTERARVLRQRWAGAPENEA